MIVIIGHSDLVDNFINVISGWCHSCWLCNLHPAWPHCSGGWPQCGEEWKCKRFRVRLSEKKNKKTIASATCKELRQESHICQQLYMSIWLRLIVRYYFSGPHTNLYPELADCYNQPDHLCGVQSNLPGISGQKVQVLGSSLKLSQRIKSNLRGESVENTGILIQVTSDF